MYLLPDFEKANSATQVIREYFKFSEAIPKNYNLIHAHGDPEMGYEKCQK